MLPVGMLFEEMTVAFEPLDQPLGVIEAVDADDYFLAIGAVANGALRLDRVGTGDHVIDFAGVDTDRESAGADHPVADRDVSVGIDLTVHFAFDIMVETVEPVLGLEADQIICKHRFDQSAMIGQRGQQAVRRPWRVEEEADPVGDPHLAQLVTQRNEVIILYPDEIVGLDQR